jgi:ComF family protein
VFWTGELPLFVWGNYQGQLKRAIAACKYQNRWELAEFFGDSLAVAWKNVSFCRQYPSLVVIPIPLHQNKYRERGFNQAELIARSFSRGTGYQFQVEGLIKIKDTQPMFGLNVEQRKESIDRAFVLGKDFQRKLPTKPILLVDDIYTTGTTVLEAARVLRASGMQVLGAIAIATPIFHSRTIDKKG